MTHTHLEPSTPLTGPPSPPHSVWCLSDKTHDWACLYNDVIGWSFLNDNLIITRSNRHIVAIRISAFDRLEIRPKGTNT